MIRCSICKRFISYKTVTYQYNEMTEEIKDIKGKCYRCGTVKCDWDCYEDLVGYGGYQE